jgi:hypothetical protein
LANAADKYAKFAYCSRFGFSVTSPDASPESAAHDSMLALREDAGPFRVRTRSLEFKVMDQLVYSRWAPWPDVEIETVLVAVGVPWHLRLHRIRSGRLLHAAEQGFALGRETAVSDHFVRIPVAGGRGVLARSAHGVSGIIDVAPTPPEAGVEFTERSARLLVSAPGTNVLFPRTLIPSLSATLEPGTYFLGCAVLAAPRLADERLDATPDFPAEVWDLFRR